MKPQQIERKSVNTAFLFSPHAADQFQLLSLLSLSVKRQRLKTMINDEPRNLIFFKWVRLNRHDRKVESQIKLNNTM